MTRHWSTFMMVVNQCTSLRILGGLQVTRPRGCSTWALYIGHSNEKSRFRSDKLAFSPEPRFLLRPPGYKFSVGQNLRRDASFPTHSGPTNLPTTFIGDGLSNGSILYELLREILRTVCSNITYHCWTPSQFNSLTCWLEIWKPNGDLHLAPSFCRHLYQNL